MTHIHQTDATSKLPIPQRASFNPLSNYDLRGNLKFQKYENAGDKITTRSGEDNEVNGSCQAKPQSLEKFHPDSGCINSKPRYTLQLSHSKFHFSKRVIDFLGRVAEGERLNEFLKGGDCFKWLQIAGVGGQGKSRLAYELVLKVDETWNVGFMSGGDLAEFSSFWATWLPEKPTLIVIDYVLGQESLVKTAFRTLAERDETFKRPVRLILVERQRWDRGGLDRPKRWQSDSQLIAKLQPTAEGRANWFLALCSRPDGDDEIFSRTKFEDGVIELSAMTPDDTVKLTIQATERFGKKTTLTNDAIIKALAHIDKESRPLYAYLLAQAFVDGTYGEGWTREDLLTKALEREEGRRWKILTEGDPPKLSKDTPPMRLAILATMIEGFDNLTMKLPEDWSQLDRQVIWQAIGIVDGPRGKGVPFTGIVPPLQPDILGEWFVLSSFSGGTIPHETIVDCAWTIAPEKMGAFLQRTTQDFPNRPELYMLLDREPSTKDARITYSSISHLIFYSLSDAIQGKYPNNLLNHLENAAIHLKVPVAIGLLGYCKLDGIGFPRDTGEGYRLTEEAANQGDPIAMFNLGLCYKHGNGVDVNVSKAVEWYQRAAEAKVSEAMLNLAGCYKRGSGVPVDPAKAAELYHRAAEAGDRIAMVNYGVCLDHGTGVAVDAIEAVKWFGRAAEIGNENAMYLLGTSFQYGRGVDADLGKAIEWYRRAAKIGNVNAMFHLGVCYEEGIGVAPDMARAIKCYVRAAHLGNGNAMFAIGDCYERGTGVKANLTRAFKWYRRGAEAGSGKAMFALGIFYENGIGCDVNPVKAVEWYHRAADDGNDRAKIALATCYENGIGVDFSMPKAIEWYTRAADAGDLTAKDRLACLPDQYGAFIDDAFLALCNVDTLAIEWSVEPLISGEWSEVSDVEASTCLQMLAGFSHLKLGSRLIPCRIRSLKLLFCQTFYLYEYLMKEGDAFSIICVLSNKKYTVLLDGTIFPLKYLIYRERPNLVSYKSVISYLELYCASFCSNGENFRVIRRITKDMWCQSSDEILCEEMFEKECKIKIDVNHQDYWILRCVVKHAGMLYDSSFVIYKHKSPYMVDMIESIPIAAELPLRNDGFEGFYRLY